MIGLPPSVLIYYFEAPVSMCNGFDGLAGLVRQRMRLEPTSGHLFLFLSKRRDRAKLLFWDKDGYALFYKRLERGRFHPPRIGQKEGETPYAHISSREMALFLEGVDLSAARRRKRFALPGAGAGSMQ